MRRRLPLLILAVLVACQPVPKPFQGAGPPPPRLQGTLDYGGVVVLPVRDAPEPAASLLARTVAAALAAAEIPATTAGGNSRSVYLHGLVVDPGHDAHILWDVRAADGTVLAQQRQPIEGMPVLPWARGEDWLMRQLAEQAAPALVAMLGGSDVPAAATVRLVPVTGAPGDGNARLTMAMNGALRAEEVAIARGTDQQALVVAGEVKIEPGPPGSERITIVWWVRDAAGGEVGRITQTNAIAAGSLNGPWGEVAELIALAAAPAVADLARRAVAAQRRDTAPPARAAAAAPAAPGNARGGYRVQLASAATRDRAELLADEVRERFAALLRGLNVAVVAAATERGTVYRVQAGPLDSGAAADALCGRLRGEGQDCVVAGL